MEDARHYSSAADGLAVAPARDFLERLLRGGVSTFCKSEGLVFAFGNIAFKGKRLERVLIGHIMKHSFTTALGAEPPSPRMYRLRTENDRFLCAENIRFAHQPIHGGDC